MNNQPNVGERWTMKRPSTLPESQDTVEVVIVSAHDGGWKVQADGGWNGMGVIFGRDFFISKIVEETQDERRARLRRPVGAADVLLVKQGCSDIPNDFLMRLMFGGR